MATRLTNTIAKYYKSADAVTLGVGENTDHIAHLAFKMATQDSITKFNMADGVMDEFEDNTGIDAGNSTSEQYDATNDHWSGYTNVSATTTVFTSVGATTWTAPTPSPTTIQVLTVAGGGGGGSGHSGGGGGAGGIVHDSAYAITAGVVYDLTVGGGGEGKYGTSATVGDNGTDSTWNDNAEGSGAKHTAKGGGGGGADVPAVGGSGGGGCANNDAPGAATNQQSAGTASGGTITSYGNAGGKANDDEGGGGGGAGHAGGAAEGGDGSANTGGPGGGGVLFSTFVAYGTTSGNVASSGSNGGYFGGGGGGSSYQGSVNPNDQPGGVGGGGRGAGYGQGGGTNGTADDGIANTGGGGGGGATTGGNGNSLQGADGAAGFVGLYYAAFVDASNVTLVSTSSTALSAPDNARIVLHEQATGTITIGTDIKAYASRDNGTTYTEFTNLALEGNYESGKRIISGSVDISGQPSGTTMRYKVRGFNNTASKYFVLHGACLSWS